MKCLNPVLVNGQYYNCGRCHCCRVNYTSKWQLRLLYELNSWNGAMFVTLTYDDEHLPKDHSLHREELNLFFKRLRRKLEYVGHDSLWNQSPVLMKVKGVEKEIVPKLRYYACGEYGSKDRTHRPHYHMILYGMDYYNDDDWKIVQSCWDKCDVTMWNKNRGRKCPIQNVTRDCIGYVTGYVQKKLVGNMAIDEYDEKGLVRPFNVSSQGLGLLFAKKNYAKLAKGYTYQHNGKRIGIPRYFRDKLEINVKETMRVKPSDRIMADYEEINRQFEEAYPQYRNVTESTVNQATKAFKNFQSEHSWTLSQIVEKQFHEREILRGKNL